MERQLDFQFLRDCMRALRNAEQTAPSYFYMGMYLRDWPAPSNNFCGTPACVVGHWACEQARNVPDIERVEEIQALLQRATHTREEYGGVTAMGLTGAEVRELFGSVGCLGAQTKEQAIAYLEGFILRNGGSLEDPQPLVVALAPDWEAMAASRTILPDVVSEEVKA